MTELRTGPLLRDGWRNFLRNLPCIALLALLIALPLAVIQEYLIDARFDFAQTYRIIEEAGMQVEKNPDIAASATVQAAISKFMLYMGLSLFISSFMVMMQAGTILLARNSIEEQNARFRDVFDETVRLFPKTWLTQLICALMISCGLMLCVLPGILMYGVFVFSTYAVVLIGPWGRKALFVSSVYSRKYKGVCFALAGGQMAFSMVVSFVFDTLLALLPLGTAARHVVCVVALCVQQVILALPVVAMTGFFLAMDPEFDFSILQKKPTAGGGSDRR